MDKTTIEIIDAQLKDIISPPDAASGQHQHPAAPRELEVATLVKDGRSSKKIAEMLSISETTVHFHPKNLRRKFGIKNSATNLRS